jgi:hypothetical protein
VGELLPPHFILEIFVYKKYILGNGGFAQEVFEQIILKEEAESCGGFIILKKDKSNCI